jgi:hypothetical protein
LERILYFEKLMASLAEKPYYNVERQSTPGDDGSWYQVMMAPFKTLDECLRHIKDNSQHYPPQHQNYKITYES